MRVVVHSPVRLFGEGVAAFVRSIDFIETVETADSADALEEKLHTVGTDLALLDITAPSSLTHARSLKRRFPDLTMVALAVADMAADVIACADAGFIAYVPRDASTSELASILRHAKEGETICDPRIARSLFDELAKRGTTPMASAELTSSVLTRREIETARLLSSGLSNKEIARELHVSVATIKNHVHSVLQKLGVSRRSQVARQLAEEPWLLQP